MPRGAALEQYLGRVYVYIMCFGTSLRVCMCMLDDIASDAALATVVLHLHFERHSCQFLQSSMSVASPDRQWSRLSFGAVIFIVMAPNTVGTGSIALMIMVFCFESCCFAARFTLDLRGLGSEGQHGG